MPSSTLEYVDMVARTPLSKILIFSASLTAVRIVSHFVTAKTPRHKQGFGVKILTGVSDLFDSLIYAAVFIFMVIRPYFFQTFQIPTGSLNPTLKVGDFIGLNKAIYARTSAYGHFGRMPEKDGGFSWERTDLVKKLRSAFGAR